MGRWERISEQVAALPDAEREAVMDRVEALLGLEADTGELSPEQVAEVERRLMNPGPVLTHDETLAFLAELRR